MGTRSASRDEQMKILNFRLRGKMAHFRRYYSNTSALTYSVPPRTTLIGLIAGLLGYERDSYYEIFSTSSCHVAVGIRRPLKKQMHKLNLLKVENHNDLDGSKSHTQIPTEILVPIDLPNGYLDYEVWFHHNNPDLMNKLDTLLQVELGYLSKGISLALGTAQHLGWIEQVMTVEGHILSTTETEIYSIIPMSKINDLQLAEHDYPLQLHKEDIPIHFNADRVLESKGDFIININGFPIKVNVNNAVQLSDGRVITWMEE